MSSFEQKPKTWAFFPMTQEDIQKKEDFYDEKGWDLDKVPTHSGKMVLPDGTVVRMEGRMIEGSRGDFFSGSCYIPQSQGGSSGGADRSRDGGRGRDDRGGSGRDDSHGRGDSRSSHPRDEQRGSRSNTSRDNGRDRDFYDDNVPF